METTMQKSLAPLVSSAYCRSSGEVTRIFVRVGPSASASRSFASARFQGGIIAWGIVAAPSTAPVIAASHNSSQTADTTILNGVAQDMQSPHHFNNPTRKLHDWAKHQSSPSSLLKPSLQKKARRARSQNATLVGAIGAPQAC